MKTISFCSLLLVLFFLNDVGVCQTYVDPEKVDDDFVFQGEYEGEIESAAGKAEMGIQVVAQGDGNFIAMIYHGGLPGSGWNKHEPERHEFSIESGTGTFKNDHAVAVLTEGKIELKLLDETVLGVLEKVERESETLGKEPPEGAYVFFDGTSADKFVSTKKGKLAEMTEDGLLKQGVNSKQRFGDCHLHIEFRLPYQPKDQGQKRGNSGLYLQGRYEVQMLDSFGLSGEHNECGGIYSIRKPDVNMCYPPLSWQTYDVDFVAAKFNESGEKIENARITVRHNGVVIHEDVELPRTTTAAPLKETVEKGFLHLQDHGNPVRYRNIWMVEK